MEPLFKKSLMRKNYPFEVFLGRIKNQCGENAVSVTGFSWDCDWYYGGGYIKAPGMHTHFDSCFLNTPDSRGHCLGHFFDPWTVISEYLSKKDVCIMKNGCAIWEDLEFFLNDIPEHISKSWWRIKDLYKQYYIYRNAAEAFQYGGHCISDGRSEKEINLDMANKINDHIEFVIIPEIIKALKVKEI